MTKLDIAQIQKAQDGYSMTTRKRMAAGRNGPTFSSEQSVANDPAPPCPSCDKKSGFDGCAHVECPRRKPWGSAGSDLEQLTAPTSHRIGADNSIVIIGTGGCFRRIAHRGAP